MKLAKRGHPDPQFIIAVAGAGVAGTSFMLQFANCMKELNIPGDRIKVILFEPQDPPGAGMPYSVPSLSYALNMPVELSSLLPGEENSQRCVEWMNARGSQWRPLVGEYPIDPSHPPRKIYGEYLRWEFRNAMAAFAKAGISIEAHPRRVINVVPNEIDDNVEVHSEGGKTYVVNAVILANGNVKGSHFPHLVGKPGFIDNFLISPHVLEQIPSQDEIVILGSQLSAVDAAIALLEQGHRGRLFMASRHGLLPQVRGIRRPYAHADFLKRRIADALSRNESISLGEVAHIIARQLNGVMPHTILQDKRGHFKLRDVLSGKIPAETLFRESLRLAEVDDVAWQSVLDAPTYEIDALYRKMSNRSRERWHAKYNTLWHSFRYSMPQINARKILKLLNREQLVVGRNLGQNVKYNTQNATFAIEFQASGNRNAKLQITVPWVIDATGQVLRFERITCPLVKALEASGVIDEAPFGGARVTLRSMQVYGKGRDIAHKNVYALGALTAGSHYFVNAIDILSRHAQRIVDHLAARIDFVVGQGDVGRARLWEPTFRRQ